MLFTESNAPGTTQSTPASAMVSALASIMERQPGLLAQARQVRQEYGDPVKGLAELLESLPGTDEEWEEFLDRP
jgi:hypothetical protein